MREEPQIKKSGNGAFHDFVNDFADVEDPLERRRLALEKIDNASFGWYHVKAICVGGVGFLTDAYDIFAINIAVTMMKYVFWKQGMAQSTETLIKVSTSVGTVIGQLGFGRLADAVGRHKIYGSELIIMITSTIFQVTLGESPAISFTAILVFWRIVQGIGIGADYPTSSVITSEFATTKHRGAIIGAVFANQGWGQILAGIVAIVTVLAYKDELIHATTAEECTGHCLRLIDQMWRILVGFGAIPGLCALYFRLTIPPSPRYQLNEIEEPEDDDENLKLVGSHSSEGNSADVVAPQEKKEDDGSSFGEFCKHFRVWKHMRILIGTAGSWFFLDVAFYGLNLNTSIILQAIGWTSSTNIYEALYGVCKGNLIIIAAGALPGYWMCVFTIDILGRRFLITSGFIIMTAIFCIIGFAYHDLGKGGLMTLFVLAQFFQNWGPNPGIYIIALECFPSKFRSTAHGISSASGKIGAIVAQSALGTLVNHHCGPDLPNCFFPHVIEIFALFMLLGIFTSVLLPETKRQTLEDLAERLHGEVNPNRIALERKALKDNLNFYDSNNNNNSIPLLDLTDDSSRKANSNRSYSIEV